MTTTDVKAQLTTFLEDVTKAMAYRSPRSSARTTTATAWISKATAPKRCSWQRGDALKALQHIVSMAFRKQLGDDKRVVVDCQHFRRDKDRRAAPHGEVPRREGEDDRRAQEIGPLNAYERRIVHMAVAEEPGCSTESIGDASVKTVIISAR